jgi:hypothetical protein
MSARKPRQRSLAIGLLLVASALGGCASGPLGAHQPSMDNVLVLRQPEMGSAAVGAFVLAPGAKAAIDKGVSVRGSVLRSPVDDSFAAFLGDSLRVELQAAGKLDPASTTVISGQLTKNELHAAGVSTADATLAARFIVRRSGASVYEKLLSEQRTWPSSFVGAVAIPEAINQYTEMYTKLLAQLFADPQFKAAVRN